MEVEAHHAGNTLTANCKTGFSLLDSHVCSLDASVTPSVNLSIPTPVPAPLENELMSAKGTVQKRRSPMPALEDTRSEKRQKRDVEDQSSFVDSTNLASNCMCCPCPLFAYLLSSNASSRRCLHCVLRPERKERRF